MIKLTEDEIAETLGHQIIGRCSEMAEQFKQTFEQNHKILDSMTAARRAAVESFVHDFSGSIVIQR